MGGNNRKSMYIGVYEINDANILKIALNTCPIVRNN